MSTKIYGGMIATDQNPFVVHKKIRAVVEPLFHSIVADWVEGIRGYVGQPWKNAVHTINWGSARYKEFGEKLVPEHLIEKTDDLHDLIMLLKQDPQHTFSGLDIGYDVVLLPNGRGLRHRPLVLLFSEATGDEYREALISAGVVEEYHYQNQSDAPKEIPPHEWDQRRQAWDKFNIPARDGLNIQMPGRFDTYWAYAQKVKSADG